MKAEVGTRFSHEKYGCYEITGIIGNDYVTVKFDNTGYEYKLYVYNAVKGKVCDKKSIFFHNVGDTYTHPVYGEYELIERFPKKRVKVRFKNTGFELCTTIQNMIKIHVKDSMCPSICGVGYIGMSKSKDAISQEPAYNIWKNMIKRCYDERVWINHPTYSDCSVCDEWHSYLKYKKWYDANIIDGYTMDKDILVKGSRVYAPEFCCFVPNEINVLFTKRQNCRGELPIGVVFTESGLRYRAQFSANTEKVYGGTFSTPEEAFLAYKQAKEAYIKEVANKWKDRIAPNVYDALMKYEVEITD